MVSAANSAMLTESDSLSEGKLVIATLLNFTALDEQRVCVGLCANAK